MALSLAQILYVEDEPTTAEVIALTLGQASVAVTTVPGEQCLALARKQRFDLILLDQRLPGMDGIETCRRLKGDDELRDLSVIFSTAFPNQAQEREAQQRSSVGAVFRGHRERHLRSRAGEGGRAESDAEGSAAGKDLKMWQTGSAAWLGATGWRRRGSVSSIAVRFSGPVS